jgi:hypothetical protein
MQEEDRVRTVPINGLVEILGVLIGTAIGAAVVATAGYLLYLMVDGITERSVVGIVTLVVLAFYIIMAVLYCLTVKSKVEDGEEIENTFASRTHCFVVGLTGPYQLFAALFAYI